ncbi:sugar ABC transporter ATP-binding protein [Breoghania sp. L-A4]|uniref:sugar ABC transporter ATP-binding protein n=1 Tax=Breoghania sp. L-A4 TaxID=2304600 RepID=UPI000E35EE87|nr:sugar ABC transporter ATP-binding protein [Breoghania sp. L-A4]AXS39823.1 sugar ABC transporter ATP-binding protein [Breoghania sp. L-A4]
MDATGATADSAPVLLQGRGISKSFGDVQVLFSVDFDIRAGEVHALLGENGAGKSTLMKILTGFLRPTLGQLMLGGEPVVLPPNGAAEALGIVLIHQELNLAAELTVQENIFLGRELRRGWFLDRARMRALTEDVLERLHVDLDPDTRIKDLAVSDKQMVEIAKAMSRDARVLVMDEPTAALSAAETVSFFEQVRRLRDQGVGIVFISHKLDEVKLLADRVTILRDGQRITTRPASGLSEEDMARAMVGRELSDMFPPKYEPDVDAPIVLEGEGISVAGEVTNAAFQLRKGEILGIAGLVGAGRTALFEAVAGLRRMDAGSLRLRGEQARFETPAQASQAGIAYLTKDRKGKGLLLNMNSRINLTLLALERFTRHGLIDERHEELALARANRRFDIRARDPGALVGSLSGGNQQKLLLAKVMEIEPEIIIVDEPTRGIDVGTKQQIYHFLAALAAEGKSIVLISSELPEIIGMSHRVAVMRAGGIVGLLEGDEIEEHEIMRYAAGLKNKVDADA